ncbi:MAG: amidohydrolase [Deltaproteobacteria bacterium]|nr:amidohydrolase [Deltaproteobacteria bacterium]MBW2723839.1 amidohydrolase [Deltaproteobacteria bacterium]
MSKDSNVLIISADGHAGALPATYQEYLPKNFHQAADVWWLSYVKEMIARTGTFFDQEAVDEYAEKAGGAGQFQTFMQAGDNIEDSVLLGLLNDGSSPFSPRMGEWDTAVRLKELEEDGTAGEVIFPQMAPFGAGLMQYRNPVDPEHNLAGIRAYNRWLADFCNANPGRHAGVALINVDDIDVSCQEVRNAKEMGLFGGVLLPTTTGEYPFYHDPRYEPLWAVCEEVEMPLQAHSGWSPDYGDAESATAMYISEVDMWAQRSFTALLWSGAFERHPGLKLIMTETGTAWILERLRVLEFKANLPFFNHFTAKLSLTPTEYFQRQCYIGASFMPKHEADERHRIGLDRIMWGSDYPHMEGTWPNTMDALRATFSTYPEHEIRAMLGTNALEAYAFDPELLGPVAERVGPALSSIVDDV